ncbi:hypothetical protein PALB_13460 [Pseudoalteromonas luteoviolacea B = ATCC 29581]|nr:hypothetical protein PALB_13460 [Pseudoalteromonas luteoviolacea B = ATCC 29581]
MMLLTIMFFCRAFELEKWLESKIADGQFAFFAAEGLQST